MRATFADFRLDRTLLDFIRTGSKRVECSIIGERVGQAGDVRTFPSGFIVTMENRALVHISDRADALSLSHEHVSAVFSGEPALHGPVGVPILCGPTHRPGVVFDLVRDTLDGCGGVPDAIYRHRRLWSLWPG